MPRKVRITTTSTRVPGRPTVDDYRELARSYVTAAGAEKADLVCLPEDFQSEGAPREQRPWSEPIPGPLFDAMAELAKEHSLWVVVPFSVRNEYGLIHNSAVMIDRQGQYAGQYAKVYPTIGECEDKCIVPGDEPVVIETDFGKVGLSICFDIGWPQHWARLKEQGAELVIWPSAYDGGFPLQAYAWMHQYYVVSSVRSLHAKVIDITGRILASTSQWHRLATTTIDLEKELFHIDAQTEKLFQIQKEMGHRVSANALSEENVFTLESNDPEWPLSRIKTYYGLENYRDYHIRSTQVQDAHRERAAATPVTATASAGSGS